MIIQFYDDCIGEYKYFIEINDDSFKEFEDFLRKYKEVHSEDYNDDEFLELIKDEDWYVKTIMVDEEVYF